MPLQPLPRTLARMDELADLMADGCPTISEAARRMGMRQPRVHELWQRICKGLGPQAQ